MRACTGPCQQGRAPCPCPDACEVTEGNVTRTALAITAWLLSTSAALAFYMVWVHQPFI